MKTLKPSRNRAGHDDQFQVRPGADRRPDERGIALVTVVFSSVVLTLLGLALTFSSLTDFSMNAEL